MSSLCRGSTAQELERDSRRGFTGGFGFSRVEAGFGFGFSRVEAGKGFGFSRVEAGRGFGEIVLGFTRVTGFTEVIGFTEVKGRTEATGGLLGFEGCLCRPA